MATKDVQLPLFANEPLRESSPEPTSGATGSGVPQPGARDPIGSEEAEMKGLVEIAVAELRGAKGDARLERAALSRWFKRGAMAGFATETLVDVLGVSSDVLDGAGYSDDEAQRVMDEVVPDISDEEIELAPLDD